MRFYWIQNHVSAVAE